MCCSGLTNYFELQLYSQLEGKLSLMSGVRSKLEGSKSSLLSNRHPLKANRFSDQSLDVPAKVPDQDSETVE